MAQIEKLESLLARLESAVTRLEKSKAVGGASSGAAAAAEAEGDAERVTALDEWYNGSFKPWLENCRKIGGLLNDAANLMQEAYDELRRIVKTASLSKKPSDNELAQFYGPLGKLLQKVDDFRAKNRGDFFDHLSGVNEGVKALSWVAVPTTVTHVKDSIPSVQFYTNKVLVKYRKLNDQVQIDWVNNFKKWQDDLAAYTKEHHLTGLAWNPQGKSFAEASSAAQSAPTKAAPAPAQGAAPPPPPPLPKNEELFKDIKPAAQGANMADVFSQINAGNVTSGLKKVSDDMKSKNRQDRTGLVSSVGSAKKAVVKGSQVKLGPPKFELVDKKWVVENQEGRQDLLIDNADMRQTVYITKCRDCVVQVKGKVNAISIDACEKLGLVFDNCVASVEVINSKSIQIQVVGRVPTVIVDKTDGCQIILSNESLDTVVVTSKGSEMNICIPKDDEYDEVPIPEQFETVYNKDTKKFVTKPVAHAAA